MKKLVYPFAIVATLILTSFTMVQSINWKISEDYSIKFTSDNPSGIFKSMSGDIKFDKNKLSESTFNIKINVESINTGNGMKNKHAKKAHWFDADNHPYITFKSTSVVKTDKGYNAIGKLKIKGIEKTVTVPFTFPNNTFTGSLTVNRLEYNVGTMDGSDKNAAKNIKVNFSIPVKK